MPRLEHYNPNHIKRLPESWIVRRTTLEDDIAVKELILPTNVPITDEKEARRILDKVNNRANQLRNPPSYLGRGIGLIFS
jgi:hypothetical protein